MFDVTAEDISRLNDIDLRELVGRLCEAELAARGLSPASVTWGGNQTAEDGGLDVRVSLPPGIAVEGFIPRRSTGFQVKKPDMPRNAIIGEMRPADAIRPVIQELADETGAYIIVSSKGSTSDSALRHRQSALREALDDVAKAKQLYTDFYDRNRLATWVRSHPGLITWVRGRVGRGLVGWRPHGPWSGAAEGADAEYLLDDKARLDLNRQGGEAPPPIADALDELRDELARPGSVVRLVGLSGVGKTRLAQSLFDARVGRRALPPAFAVYTNLSDNPDPQPTGLVSDLLANGKRAVLIVDNCPPDLHRRLSELCRQQTSTVSVLTVEYDVRDDQPEGTRVVTLEASSSELVEKLVKRRYPHISQVDARTIAEASGGNARIAIALAETVDHSDTIAGLSDEELFRRLFRQRHDPNETLFQIAQACSLVYSFQGEASAGEEAELPRLAVLAGSTSVEAYRHVGELLRRDLVQQRGVWRAVLPPAIANRLAALALEDVPYDFINQQLVEGGTDRLARSFSRRLSSLHDHPKAVSIVDSWLAPDGLLGDVTSLHDLGRSMLKNVAPVLPEAALAALERAGACRTEVATEIWQHNRTLLRSLAYDSSLFERSAQLLAQASAWNVDKNQARDTTDTFVSLFTIYLSGTHATIEQRLRVIDSLLRSAEAVERTLGLAALEAVLQTSHFISSYPFEFGARSRDYGYYPRSSADIAEWYGSALRLIEQLALTEGMLQPELRSLFVRNFRGLWTSAQMQDDLERLTRELATTEFWREGWAACRQTMRFEKDRLTPNAVSRLSALEADLRPSNLPDRVRAVVLGDRTGGLNLEDIDVNDDVECAIKREDTVPRELGAAVAADDGIFTELLPEILQGGHRTYAFGRGVASACQDHSATWERIIGGFEQLEPERRNIQFLRGFLAEVSVHSNELAQNFLDAVLHQSALVVFLPDLQSAVELDERGIGRLKHALIAEQAPVWKYQELAYGRITDNVSGSVLKDFLQLVADQPEGFHVALDILFMRLFSDRSEHREHDPELLEAGRALLQSVSFRKSDEHSDHQVADVARSCLADFNSRLIAANVATRLREAVRAHETYAFDNDELLTALFEVHPAAVLDAIFAGNERDQRVGLRTLEYLRGHRANPADVIPCESLLAWCEGDPDCRYLLAAWFITFACRLEADSALAWSEQAKALLVEAPDPKGVLEIFIKRFRPMSWSGSRAALMEANARLLDHIEAHIPPEVMPYVARGKAQLGEEIEREREWETKQDRERDERFE